jgi:hypothetical protein
MISSNATVIHVAAVSSPDRDGSDSAYDDGSSIYDSNHGLTREQSALRHLGAFAVVCGGGLTVCAHPHAATRTDT